jgi:hypothetical protein
MRIRKIQKSEREFKFAHVYFCSDLIQTMYEFFKIGNALKSIFIF